MTATNRALRPRRLLLIGVLVLVPLAFITAASALSVTLVPVKADRDISERHPSASGDWLAWSSNSEAHPDRLNAFVQQQGQSKERVNPSGTSGEAGGLDGNTFVWTQWNDRRAGDIWRIDLVTQDRSRFGSAVNTQYGEFYPTISGNWLLFTRFDWDENRFKVILFNTETGNGKVLASGPRRGPVFSGQVNGNYVTYNRLGASGSNAFRYAIDTGTTVKLPNSAVHAYGAGVAPDGTVFYLRSGDGCARNVDLLRLPLGGSVEKIRDIPAGYDADHLFVADGENDSREVHLMRVDCDRQFIRAWDTFKFVDSYTVTVAKAGSGTGTVTSDPSGISCGSDCSGVFPRGAAAVTLTATPEPGSVVVGWSIPECGSATECAVDLTADQTVTVTFAAE